MNTRTMTSALFLTIVALSSSACSPATPTPEVLADCFRIYQLAAWDDVDGDGLRGTDEPPMEGVEFGMGGSQGQIWGFPYLTDTDGHLTITTWHPGPCSETNDTISASLPQGYDATTPTSMTFALGPADFSSDAEFGFRRVSD